VISKKNKTNWIFLFILIIFATGGGIFCIRYAALLKNLPKAVEISLPQRFPLLTELDNNFLTQVNECFIPVAAVYGYTLRITSGYRSLSEQDQLYEQGRTVNGHIITWAPVGKSLHNYGFAIDVADRWRSYNIDWVKLGKIGQYCGLEQVDDPHFEHRSGLTTGQFAWGMRPPPLSLPCSVMDERAKKSQPLTVKDLKDCGIPNF
jgi:hypothetical protein